MVLFKDGDDFHRFIHPIWEFCNRPQAIEAKLNDKEPDIVFIQYFYF